MSNTITQEYNRQSLSLPILTVQALHSFNGINYWELQFEPGDIIEVYEYSKFFYKNFIIALISKLCDIYIV